MLSVYFARLLIAGDKHRFNLETLVGVRVFLWDYFDIIPRHAFG